jgi:predicted nucleic acid-binding protein
MRFFCGHFGSRAHRQRTLGTKDIIHVAAALMLFCEVFWTFDERAKKLAQL